MELKKTGPDLGMKSTQQLLVLCWSSHSSESERKAAYQELLACSKLPDLQKELAACLNSNVSEWKLDQLLRLMYASDQPFAALWHALLETCLPAKGAPDDRLLWILRKISLQKKLPPGATFDAVMKRFAGNLCLAATDQLFVLLIFALRAAGLFQNAVAQIRGWLVAGRGFDAGSMLTAQCLFLLHCAEQATGQDFVAAIEGLKFRDAGQVHAAEHLARALGTDAAKAVVTRAMVRRFLVVLAHAPRQLVQDRRAVIFLLDGPQGPIACQLFLYDPRDRPSDNPGEDLPLSAFMGVRGFTACLARYEFGGDGLRRLEVFLRLIDAEHVVPGLALAELCEALLQTRYAAGFTWVYLFNLLVRVRDEEWVPRTVNAIVMAQGTQLIDDECQVSWLQGLQAFRPRTRPVQLALAAALMCRSKLRDEAVWQAVDRALESSATGDFLSFGESDLLTHVIRELLFPELGVAQPAAQRVEKALDLLVNRLGEGRTRQLFDQIDRYLAWDDAQPCTVVCEDNSVRAICATVLRAALRSDKSFALLWPHRRLLGCLCLQAIHQSPDDARVLLLPKPVNDALPWAQQLVEVSLLRCVVGLPASSPYRPSLQALSKLLQTSASAFTAAALALAYPGTACALHLEPLTRLGGRAIGFFDALVAAIVPKRVKRQDVYVAMLENGLKHGSLKIDAIASALNWRQLVRKGDSTPAQHIGEPKCDHFDLVFCGDALPAGIALDPSPLCTAPELGALLSDWIAAWRAALHALVAHLLATTAETKALDTVLRAHLLPLLRALFGPHQALPASLDAQVADAVVRALAGVDPDAKASLPLDGACLARIVRQDGPASFVFVVELDHACNALLEIAPQLLKDAEAALLVKLRSVHQRLSDAMKAKPFSAHYSAFDVCRFELLPKDRYDNLFIGLALTGELSPGGADGPLLVEWLAGPFLLVAARGEGGELLAVCAFLFCNDKTDGRRVLAMDACCMAPQFLRPMDEQDTAGIAGGALLEGLVTQAMALARSFGAARLILPCVVGKGAIEFWKSARVQSKARPPAFSLPPRWDGSSVVLLGLGDESSGCWSIDLLGAAGSVAKTPDH